MNREVMKAEPSRPIPRKLAENLESLIARMHTASTRAKRCYLFEQMSDDDYELDQDRANILVSSVGPESVSPDESFENINLFKRVCCFFSALVFGT